MDIEMLQEMVLLMETLSFRETADQMNISQSALTKHIHRIEKELGVSLFDRTTRSVCLNQFGRAYYPYAKQLIQLHQEATTAIASLRNQDASELRVAFTPAVAPYGLVEDLSEFAHQHPEYRLKITETPYIARALKQHQCDLAFSEENDTIDSSMQQTVYCTDHLVIVLPTTHPLAGQDKISIEQLRREPFIFHKDTVGMPLLSTRKFFELCRTNGFEPVVATSACYISTILKMVAQGQGISVLHRCRIPQDHPGIVVAALEPAVYTSTYALYLKKKCLSPAARTFLNHLQLPH